MCDAKLCDKKKLNKCERKALKKEIKKYDLLSEKYSNYTKALNFSSMISMLIALVLLGVFFSITF